MRSHGTPLRRRLFLTAAAILLAALPAVAEEAAEATTERLSLSVRGTEVAEVFEMLARSHRVNIVLAKDVTGPVTVHLYDVDLDGAVHAVAEAAGFAVAQRPGGYLILKREEVGKDAATAPTAIRSFRIQYSDTEVVAKILEKQLSRYGQVTTLPARKMVVVEDLPEFLSRLEVLLQEIDAEPKQILIEAKVLEVTLDDSETFGLDWRKIFRADGGTGAVGTQGFSLPESSGLVFSFVNRNIEAFLDTLTTRGRVRTLSTPKLLALENQEAEVVVGDRTGYRVTTTINQVTTESIEFLESGVILRVRPWVDESGRVALEIHPEVSTASVDAQGIPSKTTTQVTTHLLAEDGQSVFIAGLIKDRSTETHRGVPVLGSVPVLGRLFSRTEDVSLNTETVVLITPHIVQGQWWRSLQDATSVEVSAVEGDLDRRGTRIDREMDASTRIEESLGREREHQAEPRGLRHRARMEAIDYTP